MMIKTGTDALTFINQLPNTIWSIIDTVNWDPPYFDSDNPKDVERVNQRSKLKDTKVKFSKQYTRLMDSKERTKILSIIKSKVEPETHFIYFHSDKKRLPKVENYCCSHVWVKYIGDCMAGNAERNNAEYVKIEGPKVVGKIKGRILNKFIKLKAPKKTRYKGELPQLIRACAKPIDLYKNFYQHLDSKVILDPFAGWGGSIFAAMELDLRIYACDIDSSLDWTYSRQQSLQRDW